MSVSSMASLFSSTHSLPRLSRPNTPLPHKPYPHQLFLSLKPRHFLLCAVNEESSTATEEPPAAVVVKEDALSSNGSAPSPVVEAEAEGVELPSSKEVVVKFEDTKWVNGTWNLSMFQNDGKTDWDALIDAEARRRKWLESNPESSNNDEPVVFDTSIIPWWAWMKRFHLPEAELLNGRAAMVGFFMAYFVDSLTGLGLVDQMGNFFCKTLLFVAIAGVLLIRKNEDFENLKKLLEETTFYDKQWQATWQDETSSNSKEKQQR